MENNIEEYKGAIIDPRPEEEKEQDYFIDEMVASASPVIWKEKKESEWRTYPVQNQGRESSCVANTARKMLRVIYNEKTGKDLDFSSAHIYKRRSNAPSGGMIGVDCMKIMQEGTTLFDVMPNDGSGDKAIDSMETSDFAKQTSQGFKTSAYVQFKNGDFETVASTIQETGKAVMVWFYFTHTEWSKLIPTISGKININTSSRHSVTAVDFTLKDGKKYLVIEDSSHFGGLSRRLISEEFFKARNFFSAYVINFKYVKEEEIKVEEVKITKTLRLGMRDDEVKILQNVLKTKGYFPTNIDSTGYFGSITKKAVIKFQKTNNLTQDGIVGKNTVSKLSTI